MPIVDLKLSSSDFEGKNVQSLEDKPKLSVADLKKMFDSTSETIIAPRFNELVDILASQDAAQELGAIPFNGAPANTVQGQMQNLQKNIEDIVAGIIPDGTITTEKLANNITLDSGTWDNTGLLNDLAKILMPRQTVNDVLPTTLPYGQIGVCKDGSLVVGDVDNNPKELKTIFPKKICEFNSAGTYTWVVPKDMIIDIYILGAGGAGGGSTSTSSSIYFGGAGASGFGKNIVSISVKKGQSIPIIVGAGGKGGNGKGGSGGVTSFNGIVVLGGEGGYAPNNTKTYPDGGTRPIESNTYVSFLPSMNNGITGQGSSIIDIHRPDLDYGATGCSVDRGKVNTPANGLNGTGGVNAAIDLRTYAGNATGNGNGGGAGHIGHSSYGNYGAPGGNGSDGICIIYQVG